MRQQDDYVSLVVFFQERSADEVDRTQFLKKLIDQTDGRDFRYNGSYTMIRSREDAEDGISELHASMNDPRAAQPRRGPEEPALNPNALRIERAGGEPYVPGTVMKLSRARGSVALPGGGPEKNYWTIILEGSSSGEARGARGEPNRYHQTHWAHVRPAHQHEIANAWADGVGPQEDRLPRRTFNKGEGGGVWLAFRWLVSSHPRSVSTDEMKMVFEKDGSSPSSAGPRTSDLLKIGFVERIRSDFFLTPKGLENRNISKTDLQKLVHDARHSSD